MKLFKSKKEKRREKLLKDYREGKYLKIGGEVNQVIPEKEFQIR